MARLLSTISEFERRWPLFTLWPYVLVVALGAALLFPRLGAFGLWDPWEPKYAQSAREMLERGSLVVPYFLDDVRLTKPILTYWGVLAGYAAFGINEFGARFVGVCMAIASMVGVLYAVSRVRGRRAGLLGACVLGTTPQFLFLARQATPDVYLFTSLGCGLVFFALGLFGPQGRRNLHFAIASACLALAVLAKGPIIVGVIFGGTLAIYGATRPEVGDLWLPEVRGETTRLVLGLVAAALTLGALSVPAFLFGTSSDWWWYSDEGRASVAAFREQILTTVSRTSADSILLGLLTVAGAVFAVRSVRRGSLRGGAAVRAGVFGAAATVAGLVLLVADPPAKILVASLLGMATATWVGVRIVLRFLRQPWLRSKLHPFARPLLLSGLVFVAVAGPWHVAIFVAQQSGYFTDFIIKHNIERVGETVSRGGSLGFYLDVLLHGYFPWSCLIPIGIACLVRRRSPDSRRRHGFELFLLIASLVTLVAFSASVTKFSHYLAPLLIPLAILLGLTLDFMLDRRWPAATLAWIAAAALYLPLMLNLTRRSGIEHLMASFTVKQEVPSDVAPGPWFYALLWTIAGLWVLPVFLRSCRHGVALVAAAAVLGGYLTMVFIPGISRDKSVKALCEAWEQRSESGEPICLYGDIKFGVYFYTNRQVQRMNAEDEFVEFMRPGRPAMCVVQRNRMTRGHRAFRAQYPGHRLYMVEPSHDTYATLANHALAGE